jgi:hypothetical protein
MNLDNNIVDTQPGNGRHEMLNRGDRPIADAQGGGKSCGHDPFGTRKHRLSPVYPHVLKDNTRILVCRAHNESQFLAAMQADA